MNICTIWWWTAHAGILNAIKSSKKISRLTWIVCTTDNWWSSAVVRDSLDIPSPWDVRNCINHIDDQSSLLGKLINYRFSEWELKGTHLWNLIIWALSRIYGDYYSGIIELQKSLGLETDILPVSNESTQICAELEDWEQVVWERNIIKKTNPSKIRKFFLQDTVNASGEALKTINNSDIIIICPWVLGTAIISTLLHGGIYDSIDNNSKATIIYFANVFTYPNQSDWYTTSDHVVELENYLPRKVDYLVVNTDPPPEEIVDYYKQKGHDLVATDLDNISKETTTIGGCFLDKIDPWAIHTLERSSHADQHIGTHVVRADGGKVLELIESIIDNHQKELKQ